MKRLFLLAICLVNCNNDSLCEIETINGYYEFSVTEIKSSCAYELQVMNLWFLDGELVPPENCNAKTKWLANTCSAKYIVTCDDWGFNLNLSIVDDTHVEGIVTVYDLIGINCKSTFTVEGEWMLPAAFEPISNRSFL